PRRPPRRPQELADGNARAFGNRSGPLLLGTRQPRRPRPPAYRTPTAARRRRPHPLAAGTRPGPKTCARPTARQQPGNRERGMTGGEAGLSDRLLTVAEAAEMLRTSERFPRRLIAERRIRFTRVGRHVRIPESALREFIAAGLVEPV